MSSEATLRPEWDTTLLTIASPAQNSTNWKDWQGRRINNMSAFINHEHFAGYFVAPKEMCLHSLCIYIGIQREKDYNGIRRTTLIFNKTISSIINIFMWAQQWIYFLTSFIYAILLDNILCGQNCSGHICTHIFQCSTSLGKGRYISRPKE